MSQENNQNEDPAKKEFATEAEEIAALEAESAANNADADPAENMRRQIESLTGDLQRERAEFSNFRRRALTEKTQQAAQTGARLLTDLLPALDALDQFFAAYSAKAESDATIKAIVDGVQLVHKQISRVFTEAGVEEFSPIGQEFDPAIMEALSQLEGDVAVETVNQVFQKGYRIEGRVIRPARVVVMKPKANTGEKE
jgi:molecular chaperone GrpE